MTDQDLLDQLPGYLAAGVTEYLLHARVKTADHQSRREAHNAFLHTFGNVGQRAGLGGQLLQVVAQVSEAGFILDGRIYGSCQQAGDLQDRTRAGVVFRLPSTTRPLTAFFCPTGAEAR